MLTVYFKPTTQCNINCLHCYVPKEQKKNIDILDVDKTITIFEKILFYMGNQKQLRIIFHGGEPMLMGLDYYHEIYNYFKSVKNINYSIQTNLLLYNPGWDFIIRKMFRSNIGTSFDLCRRVNNSFIEFYRLWRKKYLSVSKKFKTHIEIVVTKQLLEKENYIYSFIKKYNPNSFNFEYYMPFFNSNNGKFEISYKDYLLFLSKCHKFLRNRKNKAFGEGFIKGNCIINNITVIPNGNVSFCPTLDGIVKFGNIFQSGLKDILNSQERISLMTKMNKINCPGCNHIFDCSGGCPAYRYMSGISNLSDISDNKCRTTLDILLKE